MIYHSLVYHSVVYVCYIYFVLILPRNQNYGKKVNNVYKRRNEKKKKVGKKKENRGNILMCKQGNGNGNGVEKRRNNKATIMIGRL